MKRRRILVAVVASLVAMSSLAVAQKDDSGSIVWFSLMQSKSGKGMDLVQATVKHDAAMYDELLESGAIMSWGIAIPINHRQEDTWNHLLWVDLADWSKVGDLQAGFMKLFASRTPEQSKKIEAEFKAAVEEGSHFDWLAKNELWISAEGGDVPRYFGMGYWRAKPGSADTVTEFYKKTVAPIYGKLLADGVISGYGLMLQDLHTDPSWTHIGWYAMSGLGAVDKVKKALQAGLKDVDMSPVMEAMEPGGHWDQILLIAHLGGSSEGD